MRKATLENMITRLNAMKGFEKPEWNTVGSYRLYKDAAGYAVQMVGNTAGGIKTVGNSYGMTASECYYFIAGMIACNE